MRRGSVLSSLFAITGNSRRLQVLLFISPHVAFIAARAALISLPDSWVGTAYVSGRPPCR